MEENEVKTPTPNEEHPHPHHHKKEKELSLPMAIIVGAFIIAIAILVVRMPQKVQQVSDANNPNALDATTVTSMVQHVLASKNQVPVVPVSAADHIQGSTNPKVTIVEYSDLECPFCKNFDYTMNSVMAKYSSSVQWVYRHYPLDCIDDTDPSCTPLHPKARHEAVAAECAAEQGGNDAFWKYITQIFAVTPSNNQLDPAVLTTTAQTMGLNMTTFSACLVSDKYANIVSADAKEGLKSDVKGTPTSIIIDKMGNTYEIAGAYPDQVIEGVIDALSK